MVHGQRQTLVRLPRDGAVGHGPGPEAPHDALHRFYFLQRHGLAALVAEGQQRADGARAVLFHHGGVAVEERAVIVPQRLLQRADDLGAVQVFLRALAPAQAVTADAEQREAAEGRGKGAVVMVAAVFLNAAQANAAQTVRRIGEVGVHQRRVEAHGFKQLRALVGLQGGDAHLRGDLEYAGGQRPVVIGNGLRGRFVDASACAQRQHTFVRQIGVHRPRAKADEHGKLVNVARLAAFQQHGDGGALLFAHQMLFQRRHRQQRGDGQAFPVQPPVGEYDDVRALAVGAVAGGEQFFESALQIPRPGIEQRDGAHAEIRVAQAADALQCFGGEDGTVQFDDAAILRRRGKKVAVVADVDALVGLDLFADGVDGRVRHLREALLEVRKQRRMRVGERRQRLVRAHGGGRLHAADCHRQDRIFNILVRVAKGRAQARALLLAQRGGGGDGTGDVLKAQYAPRPFAIGALGGEARLDRAIFQQFAGPDIGHEDAAGVEPPAARDARAFLMERAGLGGEDQPALVGEGAAQRAQAVAVQRGADHVAIAVQNGGGAVPRLHHRRIVAVEVAPRRRFLLALPRLGQKHHARERQGHAVHVEKFQRVVQHLRVRAARLDDGQHAAHLFPQQRRAHRLLAGAHAVEVAADGVDLAVVQKQALRVRLGPAGKGVGGKAGVYHRQRRGVVR